MPNIFVDIRQDLVYAYVLPSWLVRPIWRVKRALKRAYALFRWFLFAIAHIFLGDLDYDVKNAKFFCGRPSRPCLCIRLAITDCPGHLEGQTSPEASIRLISTIFVCYCTPFFGWFGFRRQKCQIFRGRPSRPCLWIRLAITACSTHLEGQTSSEASIRLISTIFMCYSTPFFGWYGFRRQKFQIFSWTSIKTLSMHTVGHHGLCGPFGGSNEPRSEHTPHFDDFRVL